jgi:hypothetical protein
MYLALVKQGLARAIAGSCTRATADPYRPRSSGFKTMKNGIGLSIVSSVFLLEPVIGVARYTTRMKVRVRDPRRVEFPSPKKDITKETSHVVQHHAAWNMGKLVGQNGLPLAS